MEPTLETVHQTIVIFPFSNVEKNWAESKWHHNYSNRYSGASSILICANDCFDWANHSSLLSTSFTAKSIGGTKPGVRGTVPGVAVSLP